MEKNGLGARNPSVRLVWHESKFCGNKRPNSEVICTGVGKNSSYRDKKDTSIAGLRMFVA